MKKVFLFIILIALLFSLSACVFLRTNEKDSEEQDIGDDASDEETILQKSFYEDDIITAEFIQVFDVDGITNTTGAGYLQILISNKSNKTIWVALTDADVNGVSLTIGSGTPMTINPSGMSQQPFILFLAYTGIKSTADITNLRFKIKCYDSDTLDVVVSSDLIELTL
jgi:hypothetical protein